MFIHFTDEQSAKSICDSLMLRRSTFAGGVYAVSEFGVHVPGVQQTKLGAAKSRDFAVIFETNEEPNVWFPEEVVWDANSITLTSAIVVSADEAISLLVPHDHPSVDDIDAAFTAAGLATKQALINARQLI